MSNIKCTCFLMTTQIYYIDHLIRDEFHSFIAAVTKRDPTCVSPRITFNFKTKDMKALD